MGALDKAVLYGFILSRLVKRGVVTADDILGEFGPSGLKLANRILRGLYRHKYVVCDRDACYATAKLMMELDSRSLEAVKEFGELGALRRFVKVAWSG